VVSATGVQELELTAGNSRDTPGRLGAGAGIPTTLTVHTDGVLGCTRVFTIPSTGDEEYLTETGDTVIDLGTLSAGTIRSTCGMGMYSGEIEVTG
jgi:plastocyanin domain-containing protein